jgi:hypothetical protein
MFKRILRWVRRTPPQYTVHHVDRRSALELWREFDALLLRTTRRQLMFWSDLIDVEHRDYLRYKEDVCVISPASRLRTVRCGAAGSGA